MGFEMVLLERSGLKPLPLRGRGLGWGGVTGKGAAQATSPPPPKPSPLKGEGLRGASRSHDLSKPMLLHSAVEAGAGEAEFLSGERDIVGVLLQRLLDDLALGAFQVEVG